MSKKIFSFIVVALFLSLCSCSQLCMYKYQEYDTVTDIAELPLAPVAIVWGGLKPQLEPENYHGGRWATLVNLFSFLPFFTSGIFATKPELPEQYEPVAR